jgi:lipopolysaccharide/colanic/teichoic acid biosynthesis glycosyltransferase
VKRLFDIFLSLVGLILLCPFFLAVAIVIKLDSKGPVLYRQVRIGKDGRPFQILKFRTMMEAKHWAGPPLSPKNDPRVTALGAILRRFKLNELPQLANVLKGDM